MAVPRMIPQPMPEPARVIPPLETGDHLTREEFERRYEAMPDVKKAELIEGVVYMPSPVRLNHHGEPHGQVMAWLGTYWGHTPGVRIGDNCTVRMDLDNEPQPDAMLFIDPACGGQVRVSADDYAEGGPELVVEVAASSVAIDLHTKFRVYCHNSVREYVVWRVRDGAVDWFVLRDSQYDRLALDSNGRYQSAIFPGLCLDPAALTRGDRTALMQATLQGVASPEHAAFVARLQQASGGTP